MQKNEASIKYHYVLEEMRLEELQTQQAYEAKQRQEADVKLHTVIYSSHLGMQMQIFHRALNFCLFTVCKFSFSFQQDAFVEFLNGSYLFESMFKDDPEAETLKCVPGVAPVLQIYPLLLWPSNPCMYINNDVHNLAKSLLEFFNPTLTFEHQMVELCTQIFEIGLAEHKQRETEVNCFFSGQTKAVTDYQQRASQILANVEQQHKEVSCEAHKVLKRPALLRKLTQ